jgi:hypothetical protein
MQQRHLVHTSTGTHEFLIDEDAGDSLRIEHGCAIAKQGGVVTIVPMSPRDHVASSFPEM